MFFKDIIGQEKVKEQLLLQVHENRIPHAQMLCGPEGVGKLPLAVAYARYLCCPHHTHEDSCGVCPSCVKFNKLAHPDLHFVFPVIKRKGSSSDSAPVSDDYIAAWRALMLKNPYFHYSDWLQAMEAENQQAMIYVRESDVLLHKLMMKSSEGSYKAVIIWMPERMNEACANKLLKILEEPPTQTVFLLVTENPDQLLPTIQSRVQRLNVPRLEEQEINAGLQQEFGVGPNDATAIAHQCMGSWLGAMEAIQLNDENRENMELFTSLMRLTYMRKIREMKQWSEQVASLGRERQKRFFVYCQRMIRENFIYNFKRIEMVYMLPQERDFAKNFAPYVNENNVMGLMDELSRAQQEIEQNANAKIVLFDMTLKITIYIKNR